MRIAYLDLAHGASGDMIMAGLAHAGRSLGIDAQAAVTAAVASLDLGCAVRFTDDERGGFRCLRAEVKTDDTPHPPDRIREAMSGADVEPEARRRALDGFEAIVAAEAAVHGTDPDDVHLHELGSADTPADLVGAAAGFAALGVTEVAAAAVPVPSGWIDAAHGPMPLPAPATLELLRGARLRGVEESCELVTPTAAAILTGWRATFGPLPDMSLLAVGVAAGQRTTEVPNICRVLYGTPTPRRSRPRLETLVVLEANIDDQSPEGIAHALEALLEAGTLDAWVTPIVMKKSRPAFLLSALVRPNDEEAATEVLFRQTTTLGIRRREADRWTLDREEIHVEVDGHDVAVKVGRLSDEVVTVAAEFEDCAEVVRRTGRTLRDVQAAAVHTARIRLGL